MDDKHKGGPGEEGAKREVAERLIDEGYIIGGGVGAAAGGGFDRLGLHRLVRPVRRRRRISGINIMCCRRLGCSSTAEAGSGVVLLDVRHKPTKCPSRKTSTRCAVFCKKIRRSYDARSRPLNTRAHYHLRRSSSVGAAAPRAGARIPMAYTYRKALCMGMGAIVTDE